MPPILYLKKLFIFCIIYILFVSNVSAIQFRLFTENLTSPLEIISPSDKSGRLFVAEQQGIVNIIDSKGNLIDKLLDIKSRMISLDQGFEERGLLGFALHPEFLINGKLYITYSAPLRERAPKKWNYTRRISELTLSYQNKSKVDLDTERVLIEIDWPTRKHNGGGLAFGPDGYLYIGLGDGGGAHGMGEKVIWSAFDVPKEQLYWDKFAQDIKSLFGSILRIDPDSGFPGYGIPKSNPFVGKIGRDEIYAWGFRNPYRIAFDKNMSGEFLVSATGETLWESIFLVNQAANFGWPIREGSRCIDRTSPRNPPKTCPNKGPNDYRIYKPIIEYQNMQVMHPKTIIDEDKKGVGTAVVGGRFYRGDYFPEFQGKIIFADWSSNFKVPSGQIFIASPPKKWGDPWSFKRIGELNSRIISVGEDNSGEIYILTNDNFGPYGKTGKIFKMMPN